jgi:hypothetical protein
MRGLQVVRTNAVHGVLIGQEDFIVRSKQRMLTKEQIFEAEELTNYAAVLALTLRHELGEPDADYAPPEPLPARPSIPGFLETYIN